MFDVFISHASEDKEEVVYPLVEHLDKYGVSIWLDRFEIKLGDSLREKIDEGLTKSNFGIIILSQSFFAKKWTNRELDGLFAIEENKGKVILPIWHNVTSEEVSKYSPLLAAKVAVSTSLGMELVAEEIFKALKDKETIKNFYRKKEIQDRNKINFIRQELLLNNNRYELKKLKYEIEEYQVKYPHSVDAKMLHDDIKKAISWEDRPMASAPCESTPKSSPTGGVFSIIFKILLYVFLGILGGIALWFLSN